MCRSWTKAASSIGLVAAIGFGGGFAFGAPPPAGERDYPPAKDARDTSRNTERDTRDANRGAKDAARDSDKGARDSAGDAGKGAKDAARDTDKGARDTARDTDRDARDARDRDNRDRGQDARDSRDSGRDERNTARDTQRGHRSVRDLGLTLGRMTDRGLTVGRLASTSLVARAGLREGDVIVSVNGHRLRGDEDFERWLFDGGRRDRATIVVWRDDREETIYLEPTVLYTDDEAVEEERPYFGIDFNTDYGDRVVIRRVYPNSPAFAAGLRAGDVITTWNGTRVTTPEEFVRTIRGVEPGTVNFEYMRDSKRARAEAKFDRRETKRDIRK